MKHCLTRSVHLIPCSTGNYKISYYPNATGHVPQHSSLENILKTYFSNIQLQSLKLQNDLARLEMDRININEIQWIKVIHSLMYQVRDECFENSNAEKEPWGLQSKFFNYMFKCSPNLKRWILFWVVVILEIMVKENATTFQNSIHHTVPYIVNYRQKQPLSWEENFWRSTDGLLLQK